MSYRSMTGNTGRNHTGTQQFRNSSGRVGSYLTKDINVKGLLKQYRNSLEEKYPDPKPKNAPAEEVASPAKAGGKGSKIEKPPSQMDRKGAESKKTGRESQKSQLDIELPVETIERESDEVDSIILDDEEQMANFTGDLCMVAGAPYHPKV